MNVRSRLPWRGLLGLWQTLTGRQRMGPSVSVVRAPALNRTSSIVARTVELAPDDPLVAYFQILPNAVELDKLEMDSPALRALKAAGVSLIVPLANQGELVGLLNLGPRPSEQPHSADERGLLDNLAMQAGPAARVAQLVRQQQAEFQARERLEQELRVARLIQQTLLPKELPAITGWGLAATYRPARAVGGDFYDFINLPDGRLGLVIGDVTDKGVPAALLMATTRATLRSAALQFASPGEVLERVNEQLCPEVPPKMFVTCLYAVLDTVTGRLEFANAGHDLPYRRSGSQVEELRATGMPLGLMPGMHYEVQVTHVQGGDSILFYTDGIVEAHNPQREMFGFPRLRSLMAGPQVGAELIDFLLAALAGFTGPAWEQEDDVSLLTLECAAEPVYVRPPAECLDEAEEPRLFAADPAPVAAPTLATRAMPNMTADRSQAAERSAVLKMWESHPDEAWRVLADFELESRPGNERVAIERVAEVVRDLALTEARLERLKTAVGEATMNAMEHGNRYQVDVPAEIRVVASRRALVVQVTDHSGSSSIPSAEPPDLEAKLNGLQSPRGWGLFLIQNLVDEMNVVRDTEHHTIELIMHLTEGAAYGGADT